VKERGNLEKSIAVCAASIITPSPGELITTCPGVAKVASNCCDGHHQISCEYHYHSLSRGFKDIRESTVLGFALDGFPITGPVQSNGQYLSTAALDECHGTTSAIMLDGKKTTMYHYVMTQDFPYSVRCFRGKPVSLQVITTNNLQGQSGLSGNGQGSSSGCPKASGQMGGSGLNIPPQSGQKPPMGPPPMGQ